MKYFFSLEAPWHFAVVNARGEVTDGGEVTDAASFQPPDGITEFIGLAPGEAVTIRSTIIPGRRRSHVEAAMPYALEDSLSEDVEALHFTLLHWQPEAEALVAVVARQRLAGWIASAGEAGLRVDHVIPGYLLLPRFEGRGMTVSPLGGEAGGETLYVRTGDLTGFAIDRSFLGYWLEDETPVEDNLSVTEMELARELTQDYADRVRHWEIGKTPVDWLRIAPADEVVERVNLLHGDFLPAHQSRDLRPLKVAAALALAAAVLMYGSLLLESRELKARDMALNQQMKTLFQQQFPGEPWLGRPQYQVQTLLDARDGGTDAFGFQFLLEVITGMTRQHGAQIEELNFRDDEMIVLCNVRSLSVLDDIRQGLQGLPGLTAELLSSGARDNQISGRFRVSRG